MLCPELEYRKQDVHTEMNVTKKILLVEDDKDLREMLGEMLEWSGYETIHASSREEAFQILKGEMPDLILLDLMLPDGNGLDICRHVTGRKGSHGLPSVFVMSGRTGMESKLSSFIGGAKRFFEKPFEMDNLIDAVDASLSPGTEISVFPD